MGTQNVTRSLINKSRSSTPAIHGYHTNFNGRCAVNGIYRISDIVLPFNWAHEKLPGLRIDLYHTAAILSPRRTKTFVFARRASHWMRGDTGKIFRFSIAF